MAWNHDRDNGKMQARVIIKNSEHLHELEAIAKKHGIKDHQEMIYLLIDLYKLALKLEKVPYSNSIYEHTEIPIYLDKKTYDSIPNRTLYQLLEFKVGEAQEKSKIRKDFLKEIQDKIKNLA